MRFVARDANKAPACLTKKKKKSGKTETQEAIEHYDKWKQLDEKARKSFKYQVYGREEVKEALVEMFDNKCAYCESRMKHASPAHIEHYRPKNENKFPDQMFVWENWLLSCTTCNTMKREKFPYCDDGQPCFINPAIEDPGKHIDFLNAQILARTDRGEITIREIVLDRAPLVEERARWLNCVNIILLLLLTKKIPE